MSKSLPTFEDISKPVTPFSLKWFKWGLFKLILNTIGRLSKGIRMGFKYGFDSGQMLDYVYENKPQGVFFIGRFIDKIYLNGPGWIGIRQRKIHLKMILKEIIENNNKIGKETTIMDLASGPGRYLLETIQEKPNYNFQVICRDINENGLEQGKHLAKELGIKNIKYEKSDAFSLEDLKRANPQPNVVVVSGLYELFTDNDMIKKSMKDIFAVLAYGDLFIFTNQPYHPQVEVIARCLPNREGKLWVMRLRSDDEVRKWVEEAGFKEIKIWIDKWGIFSVHLAMKKLMG